MASSQTLQEEQTCVGGCFYSLVKSKNALPRTIYNLQCFFSGFGQRANILDCTVGSQINEVYSFWFKR